VRLAVVGSRSFADYKLLCDTLDRVKSSIEEIISGGAAGADALAARYAREHGIPLVEIKAEWAIYGKQAGYMRNYDIIERCDGVVAFWDGASKGTKHDINLAREMRKRCFIVRFN
jgi:hypothetical protein